jgi:2-polyprenyl-3-methyl-5-hydroxy-6-metoxy-1,4-benzoquinol methylase
MKQVQDFYNKYPYPISKQYTNKQIKKNNQILLNILKIGNIDFNNIKNKKILVAGCGTGEKSVLLAKNGALVTAIDFSDNQIKEAKLRAKDNNLTIKNIEFIKKDLINDNLEDLGTFDIILSLGVLHHSEDAYFAFTKIAKLLNKNGIIIIGLYHRYSRLRFRILRFIFRNFISKDPDKLIDWIINKQKFSKKLKRAPTTTLYDRYGVPFESYHTVFQVKKWFKKNDLSYFNCSDKFKGIELFKIFEKKTIFFVSGIRK